MQLKLTDKLARVLAVAATTLGGLFAAPNADATEVQPNVEVARIETFKHCDGAKVSRCIWLNVDHINNRWRAYGEVKRGPGGGIYDVAVRDLHFEIEGILGGPDVFHYQDHDGWHAGADGVWSELIPCTNGKLYHFTLAANFAWRNRHTGNTDSEKEQLSKSFLC